MKGVVLDTHIWLWYLAGDTRLSPQVADLLSQSSLDIWISSASIWEALILGERGRVKMVPDPERWIQANLTLLQAKEALLTWEIAYLSRSLEFDHADPIDRFIAATAFQLNIPLVTADASLQKLSWLTVVS
jgi:PIN domain nuclease of toxin-antitoxin system